MAKLAKTTVFTTTIPQKETQLDKTARIVRRIKDDEAEIRHVKTARLRKARYERENMNPANATSATLDEVPVEKTSSQSAKIRLKRRAY